jgi:hypothetical protein
VSDSGSLRFSEIFKWFANDFGDGASAVVKWMLSKLESVDEESRVKRGLQEILKQEDAVLEYEPYDWTLNAL